MAVRLRVLSVVVATLLMVGAAWAQSESEEARGWDFEADAVDAAPAGFIFGVTGKGAPGQWMVRTDPEAPSGSHVLAQTSAERVALRFPLAVVADVSRRDLRASVRCKAISGSIDRACGLLFRFRDENNYYVARANALNGTVILYAFTRGQAREIAGWLGTVSTGVWHHLSVTARGDHIEVFWDAVRIIDRHDTTHGEAGRVGLWTKSDSVTEFDDLAVAPVSND